MKACKRFLCALMAALMLLLPACAEKKEEGNSLETLKLLDGETPELGRLFTAGSDITLVSMRLNGSRGSDDPSLPNGNGREYAAEGVRFAFERGEWIELSLKYEYSGGAAKLGVWLFPHRNLDEYGELDKTPGNVLFTEYELPYETYPAPLEDEFSAEEEFAEAGLYDMLFTLNGALVGRIVLSFA